MNKLYECTTYVLEYYRYYDFADFISDAIWMNNFCLLHLCKAAS